MRWPFARQTLRPDPQQTVPRAGGQELVTIEAGPVTLTGTLAEVRKAVAVGLYGEAANPPDMSKEEDHVMTGVYVGVGLLLAAGAGYLAWRYLLDDAQKQQLVNKSRDVMADGVTKASRAVRDAKSRLGA